MADLAFDPDSPMDDGLPFGTPEAEITWQVDVSAYLAQRRRALEAHRSQQTDIDGMLALPEEVFAAAFGVEHYIEPGAEPGMRRGWPFAGELGGAVTAGRADPGDKPR